MSMGKRARKNGNEQDAFSKHWRRYMTCFQRAGVAKATKQIANRRDRRVRDWLDDIFDFDGFDCD